MNVIDLFAGCGGLSTGFEMCDFRVKIAIEKDLWASETYKFNHKNTKIITEDIKQLKNLNFLFNEKIDGIIGGPPCQGFSLSGKRDKKDPRNSLFMEFVRFVKVLQPKFFIMENVPGILSMKTESNELVLNIILNEYKNAGYNIAYKILNSADFGVPQLRHRVFFIGIRKDIKFIENILFPLPEYFDKNNLLNSKKYISIYEAIMDLPQIEAGEGIEEQEYTKEPFTEYQKWARGNEKILKNHVAMKHTKRLIERFKNIKQGQSLKDVDREHMQRERGNPEKISGKVYSQNNMRPYGDRPSPTIAATFQGNFIHPYLNRNYTAREAARLQSFPDYYVFKGKRTVMSWEKNLSQYQQIGNAVPPLLAKAIANNLKKYFKKL